MRVELIPSTVGDQTPHQFCTSVLIDDSVAIDAGALGILAPVSRQFAVNHVFLSHCHIDHVATLPMFLDNVYQPDSGCVDVYASAATQRCLREDIFNDRLWPDFIGLSEKGPPFLSLKDLRAGQVTEVDGLRVRPILLDHNVPTFAFIVEGNGTAVAFASDTGPTNRLWDALRSQENLVAVFLECSFPNSLSWLAEESRHLCPNLFARELEKLNRDADIFAYHIKPTHYDEVVAELKALGNERVQIATPGHTYSF